MLNFTLFEAWSWSVMARKVAAPLGEFVRGLGGGLCCLNQRIREFFRKKIAKCSAPSQRKRLSARCARASASRERFARSFLAAKSKKMLLRARCARCVCNLNAVCSAVADLVLDLMMTQQDSSHTTTCGISEMAVDRSRLELHRI